MHFEVLLSGPSRCYYLGQVDCNLKMANLAQIITPQICASNLFSKRKCWNPYFIVLFDKQCFVKKTNLAQIITPQMAKLGPDNNTTAYIYIYIYTDAFALINLCIHRQTGVPLFAFNARAKSLLNWVVWQLRSVSAIHIMIHTIIQWPRRTLCL